MVNLLFFENLHVSKIAEQYIMSIIELGDVWR